MTTIKLYWQIKVLINCYVINCYMTCYLKKTIGITNMFNTNTSIKANLMWLLQKRRCCQNILVNRSTDTCPWVFILKRLFPTCQCQLPLEAAWTVVDSEADSKTCLALWMEPQTLWHPETQIPYMSWVWTWVQKEEIVIEFYYEM